MMEFKDFQIGDIFEVLRGKSGLTRDYARVHTGNYPVYSASREAPLAHINSWDFDGEFLSWTTNGYAGYVQGLEGKFSINADRGLLKPKHPEQLDLDYCRKIMQPKLRPLAVGRIIDGKKNEYTKLSPGTVAETFIPLPVNEKGEPDKKLQIELAKKYIKIESFLKEFDSLHERIDSFSISITHQQDTALVSLGSPEFFTLQIGNRVLKKDIQVSGIPVYSANVNQPFGHVEISNLSDFTKPLLLWGIDGIFDWNYIAANNPIATTDHCGSLTINNHQLDSEYIFFALKASKAEYGFDRVFRASLENVKDTVNVRVPIDNSGAFDLVEQKRIAENQKRLQNMRSTLLEQLEVLSSSQIIFE